METGAEFVAPCRTRFGVKTPKGVWNDWHSCEFSASGNCQCGSVDPQIPPRRCSSTAGREGRARLKRAFSPKGGTGRANKGLYELEVQSQEDTNVSTYSQGQRPKGRGVADGIESRSYARPTLEGSSTEVGLGTISSDQARVTPFTRGRRYRKPAYILTNWSYHTF